MITTNFQKWGALVASLASILTLSSAAEAIVITSPTGPSSGRYSITSAPAIGAPARTNVAASLNYTGTPFEIQSLNSVTINGLSLTGSKGKLTAKLTAFDLANSTELLSMTLFGMFTSAGSTSSLSLGDYKFTPDFGSTWATNSSAPGTYMALDPSGMTFGDFAGYSFDSNTKWTLDVGNGRSAGTGSFSSFSVDATAAAAVPFESDAAPAGVVIVFGALMLRRKLQQRSAQKMSLESVNS